VDRARRLNSEVARDPFLRRLVSEQDRRAETLLRDRGRAVAAYFDARTKADLEQLVEAGAARCDDPEAVVTLLRAATAGWAMWDRAGQPQVDHHRMLEAELATVRALLRPE
jgi:hypothetical protein